MKLIDTLKEMRNLYRKAPNVVTEFNLLTLVVGECERVGKDVDDLAVLSILRKMHGANVECLKAAPSGKLTDENTFLDQLLEKYTPEQPKQLTESQIIHRITQNGITNLGDAMKWLKANCAGEYDSKMASDAFKQHFAK